MGGCGGVFVQEGARGDGERGCNFADEGGMPVPLTARNGGKGVGG